MADPTTSKRGIRMSTQPTAATRPRSPRRGTRAALAVVALLAAISVFAIPAQAKPEIGTFEIRSTNTEAGAHPDINTRFSLLDAGSPEVAKTIEAKWPTGVFGNPEAVPRCSNVNFALNECPTFSQIGWVGVRGNFGGDPLHIFGAAPLNDKLRFPFGTPGEPPGCLGTMFPSTHNKTCGLEKPIPSGVLVRPLI